ncbi:bifunctional hydroxymethylpyrimidine kinase/phosphomethylpyrimidine kinase [soil metagenome]
MSPAPTPPRLLTIAGSDSGGGAGIQADLKTFQELDAFGMSVLTALTAQNTVGVHGVHDVPPDFVRAQLDAVASDIGVDAAKTGMLSSREVIRAVAEGIAHHRIQRLVVDPVCASKHGDPLLRPDAVDALRDEIVPLAEVVTPNTGEVTVLTGLKVTTVDDMRPAAEALKQLGPAWVLVKGGHLADNPDALDLLYDGSSTHWLAGARSDTRDTHGTGCTLAAAIAVHRARGLDVPAAAAAAKDFVTGAIRHGIRLGAAVGPVDHGWARRTAH